MSGEELNIPQGEYESKYVRTLKKAVRGVVRSLRARGFEARASYDEAEKTAYIMVPFRSIKDAIIKALPVEIRPFLNIKVIDVPLGGALVFWIDFKEVEKKVPIKV